MKELEDANALLEGFNATLKSLAEARQEGEAAEVARAQAEAARAREVRPI